MEIKVGDLVIVNELGDYHYTVPGTACRVSAISGELITVHIIPASGIPKSLLGIGWDLTDKHLDVIQDHPLVRLVYGI